MRLSWQPQPGVLQVVGATPEVVGETAAARGIVLHELTAVSGSLEEAYLALTAEEVEYHSGAAAAATPTPAPSTAQTDVQEDVR